MAKHAKKITQLEIKKKKEKPQAKFFCLATTFSLGLSVVDQNKNKDPDPASKLDRNELSHKAAVEARGDMTINILPPFSFANKPVMLYVFSSMQWFVTSSAKTKLMENISELIKPLIPHLIEWLPGLFTNVWKLVAKREQERKPNLDLR